MSSFVVMTLFTKKFKLQTAGIRFIPVIILREFLMKIFSISDDSIAHLHVSTSYISSKYFICTLLSSVTENVDV